MAFVLFTREHSLDRKRRRKSDRVACTPTAESSSSASTPTIPSTETGGPDARLLAALLSLGDLATGVVYMFGLTKELGLAHSALLCDRLVSA